MLYITVNVEPCLTICTCFVFSKFYLGCVQYIVTSCVHSFSMCLQFHTPNRIYFCICQSLSRLCSVVTSCVSAFSVDFFLQTNMYHCGVLWHLLQFLFRYDYTLEEGGVAKSDNTNEQVIHYLHYLLKLNLSFIFQSNFFGSKILFLCNGQIIWSCVCMDRDYFIDLA